MSTQKNEFLCSCQCNKRLKILFWVYSIFSYLKISQWLKNYYYPNLKAYYTYTFYALILWITHRHFAYLCGILTGIVNSWNNLLECEQLLKTFLCKRDMWKEHVLFSYGFRYSCVRLNFWNGFIHFIYERPNLGIKASTLRMAEAKKFRICFLIILLNFL